MILTGVVIFDMKILHVWDVAGVASILAKWQKKLGHETKVIMLRRHDPMGITSFYNETYDMRVRKLIPFVLKEARGCDVIHVHNLSEFLPLIRARCPGKRIIIHHHGFTSATKWFVRLTHLFADRVFVATHDLLDVFPNAVLIPTPVDTDHFRKGTDDGSRDSGTGEGKLAFHMRYLDLEMFKEHAKDDTIEIVDREREPIPYERMPDFLKRYGTYYDIKYMDARLIAAHSKTCLEALACGLDVIDHDGKLLHEFPMHHCPEYSAKLCIRHYGVRE
jgi:hypothetical protein